jgi:folate-binding protein YgfZ
MQGSTDANTYSPLDDRAVLALSGADRMDFLQGLVTGDVTGSGDGQAIYAALLSPQGKYLHDFLLCHRNDALWLDCEGARKDDLINRLTRYRLRAKVEFADISSDVSVFAVTGPAAPARLGLGPAAGAALPFGGGIAFTDPRNAALGARVIAPAKGAEAALKTAGIARGPRAAYDRVRLALGIAEGGAEVPVDQAFPLEFGLDALNGVSFDKGCFVGQEVTVRMKNRSLVRKRATPVAIEGPAPETGARLALDGKDAGVLCAAADGIGLALIGNDALARARAEALMLTNGETKFRVLDSGWDSAVTEG